MNGSTQTQIVEVENLLRNAAVTLSTPALMEHENTTASTRFWSFDTRPVIASCLALLIFAPGCAAAAVFLMRADGTVPPMVQPDSNPPFVTKTDRLPIEQWSVTAVANLGAADETRIATAGALADPAFLSPILIRGSLEDGTLTTFAEPAVTTSKTLAEPVSAAPKPRVRSDARRAKTPKLVAEITQPPPPQPSFFEKLFRQTN